MFNLLPGTGMPTAGVMAVANPSPLVSAGSQRLGTALFLWILVVRAGGSLVLVLLEWGLRPGAQLR